MHFSRSLHPFWFTLQKVRSKVRLVARGRGYSHSQFLAMIWKKKNLSFINIILLLASNGCVVYSRDSPVSAVSINAVPGLVRFTNSTKLFKNPSISEILRWVAGTMGQMNCWPSVWCSKYYFFFHDFLQNSLQKSFQLFIFYFYNSTKIKSFEYFKSIKSLKKIIVGTSDAW